MAGHTPGLVKGFKAEAAIARRRIVKFGAGDGLVLQGAAVGDALIGVTTEIDAAIGEPVDVVMSDITDVEYGGAVTRGDWLTSDAVGRAVVPAPAAGANANVIGRALASGVLGDVGAVFIAPGRIQG